MVVIMNRFERFITRKLTGEPLPDLQDFLPNSNEFRSMTRHMQRDLYRAKSMGMDTYSAESCQYAIDSANRTIQPRYEDLVLLERSYNQLKAFLQPPVEEIEPPPAPEPEPEPLPFKETEEPEEWEPAYHPPRRPRQKRPMPKYKPGQRWTLRWRGAKWFRDQRGDAPVSLPKRALEIGILAGLLYSAWVGVQEDANAADENLPPPPPKIELGVETDYDMFNFAKDAITAVALDTE